MATKSERQGLLRWFEMPAFWMSVALSLGLFLIYLLPLLKIIPPIGMLENIEAKTLDLRFLLRGQVPPDENIVILAVDEKAEGELGRWQSSGRRWLAKLLDILKAGGAKVVGFDLVLAEPGESAVQAAVDEIKTFYLAHLQPEGASQPALLNYFEKVKNDHDYDQQLADAIQRQGNVILGIYHFPNAKEATYLTPEKLAAFQQIISKAKYKLFKFPPGIARQPLRLTRSFGGEANLPIFSEAAKSLGHFNAFPSRDGYIRQSPLLIEYQDNYYPSLALEVVRAYLHPALPPIIAAREAGGISGIRLGKLFIPTDTSGRLLINYYGKGKTFPHYPISDVVLGKIPPDTFQNKIVILGFTAAIYQDLHPTPFEPNYPGVETHATVVANILNQDFLTRPSTAILADGLILIGLGLFLGILLPRRPLRTIAVLSLICLLGVPGIAYSAFRFQHIWLNITFPCTFILLNYLVITTYNYFIVNRKRKELKHAFQHYVAPAVVEQMLEKIDQLHLGGERKQLTAFFSDIRGFTSISEKMSPEDLVRFLNEYLSEMTRIVLKYEGTVDKYMGDAIMAFYGAPLGQPDHAIRACKTAVEMIARLKELWALWETRGLPRMNIGIGINSGEMSVGNMGSEERFDYTIMGDHVNLASRLEGINKQYGTNIAISQFTYTLIPHDAFIVRELDSVRVKGKQQPVMIYELIGYGAPNEQTQAFLKKFHEGLEAYKHRQWSQAIALFFEALNLNPEDKSCCRMYIERCEKYAHRPPPEDWDGVFAMETK